MKPSPRRLAAAVRRGPGDVRRTLGETGIPVMLGLFCEVDAGVLLASAGALGLHGATAYRDQAYAEEMWRCLRVRPTLRALPEPAEPATEALREPDPASA